MDQHKRDFSVNDRLLKICGLAAVIGGISTLAAVVLLALIHLFTNLFFFGTFSIEDHSPALNTLGPWVIASSDRRTDRRADGALRLREDPRPRHS